MAERPRAMDAFIALSLIAGLMAIDDRAGWQSLLAQPVFAALVVGWVVGEVAPALAVGVVLELVWLSILPMRGLKRPDQIAGSVVGAGSAALVIHLTADPRFVFVGAIGVAVGLVSAEVSARATSPLFQRLNAYLGNVKMDGPRSLSLARRLGWLHASALVYIFAVEAVVAYALLRLGYAATDQVTRHVSGALVIGANYWDYLLPALGVASLIHLYWHQHLKRVLVLSAALVTLVLWLQ